MECDKVWDLLSVYADGEASPEEATIVETHVASCPDCARDLQFMMGTHEVLQDVPQVEPPVTLRSAILAATVYRPSFGQRLAETVRKTLAPAPVRYGALAAAGAAAALTAVVLKSGKPPVSLQPPVPETVATAPVVPPAPSVDPDQPRIDLLKPFEVPTGAPKLTVAEQPRATGRVRTASAKNARPSATQRPASKRSAQPTATGANGNGKEASSSDDMPAYSPMPSDVYAALQLDPEPETRVASGGSATTTEPATPETPAAPARSARIILATSSAMALDPRQVATLADLRRSLAQNDAETRTQVKPNRERQIRVDLIRGSF